MLDDDTHRNLVALVPAALPAESRIEQPLIGREQRDLLCALAYVALGIGDADQAVTLLALVARETPDDAGVLRLLAYAHVEAGDGALALAALDRLATVEPGEAPPLLLLRSHALRLAGDLTEGQAWFRRFVEARNRFEEARS
ncbi:histidine kinase [Methylobacterium brachythecii]|uniref:Flp pilus assembly protein TadD n=1 Tax=Methylobacterium brachythecii TaxID=1176177 RepID=A0A7W6AH86_9HYPH|nr:histidine kinase [Methylobacterium brachythecii]MBB3903310.1 Flp pilus assembly protein TadD [Methylobacterium brachythecii]GLS46840.1 hypothetical protein GCM10007884_48370 [Methylobacterium brachythecii]